MTTSTSLVTPAVNAMTNDLPPTHSCIGIRLSPGATGRHDMSIAPAHLAMIDIDDCDPVEEFDDDIDADDDDDDLDDHRSMLRDTLLQK